VVWGVSVGVVVCSVVFVWASGADEDEDEEGCVDVEAAWGACTGALRAFAELDLCA
jgi:hypothetical protein